MRQHSLLFLAVFVLFAVSCSGGGTSTGVATLADDTDTGVESTDGSAEAGEAAASTDDVEAQMLEFAECMRDEGVDIDDPVVDSDGSVDFGGFRGGVVGPGGGDGGGPPEGLGEAFDSCGELLEGLQLGGGPGGFNREGLQDSMLEFAQCMRDEGIDMNDPDFSNFGPGGDGPGEGGGPFGDIDPQDPAFQAAADVCGEILAGFGRGPGAGGRGSDET